MKAVRFITWRAAGFAGLLTLALPLMAQQNAPTNAIPPAGTPTSGTLGQIQGGGQVLGKPVFSSDNQQVGTLKDLVVDLVSGRVLYGVVGTSRGNLAVAPGELQTYANNRIQLKVPAQKIMSAPQFTSAIDQPGQIAKADFIAQVYQYYGENPWWQGSTPVNQGSFYNVQKESSLIGKKVENAENQPLGTVASMQIDLNSGHVLYVLLTPDPSLGLPGGNYDVLPPQAFTLAPNGQNLVSGIDKQKLASSPAVTRSTWSKLNDPTFASQVYQYYGKEPYFGSTLQPTGR